MSRSFRVPPYPKRPHKSGLARIKINGKQIYLGKHGSKESRQKYAAIIAEYVGKEDTPAQRGKATIKQLVAHFLRENQAMPEKELWHFERVSKALLRRFGALPASMFGTVELGKLRSDFISGDWLTDDEKKHPKATAGWSARMVNRGVNRIRTIIRWGEEKGHVPEGRYSHLLSLRSLSQSANVRRTKPRQGVDLPALTAILPHLPPSVAALAEIQWWTGMRPSEATKMKPKDVEAIGDTWLYWITGKNSWREGRGREAVVLGPEAIRVLTPWLNAAKMKGAEVPIFPSGKTGRQYTVGGYGQAMAGAFELHPELERFTSYQLRHSCKRRITRELGLDAARAALRQSSVQTTALYDSARDMQAAIEVAKKTG